MNLRENPAAKGLALSISLAVLFLNSCLFAKAEVEISTSEEFLNPNTYQARNHPHSIMNDIELQGEFPSYLINGKGRFKVQSKAELNQTFTISGSSVTNGGRDGINMFNIDNLNADVKFGFENLNFKHFAHFEKGLFHVNVQDGFELNHIKISDIKSANNTNGDDAHVWGSVVCADAKGRFSMNDVEISDIEITSTNTDGPNLGGAIHIQGAQGGYEDSILYNLDNSKFDNVKLINKVNNSTDTQPGGAYGGAIHVGGELRTVSNTQFTNNLVQTTVDGQNAQGGVIYAGKPTVSVESEKAGSKIGTIENSLFENNSAKATTGFAKGGAIAIDKDAIIGTIENTVFKNNSASHTNGGHSYGGAIYTDSTIANISGSEFYNNSAGTLGGAVYVGEGANLTLENGTKMFNNKDGIGANDIYLENDAHLMIKYDPSRDGVNTSDNTVTIASGLASQSDRSSVTISDGANLALSGDNSRFKGETLINTGTLTFNSRSANDKYLKGNTYIGADGKLAVNADWDAKISKISGQGQILKEGDRALILYGDNSNFNGDLIVNNGTFALGKGASIGSLENSQFGNNTVLSLKNSSAGDSVHFNNLDLNGNVGLGLDVNFKDSVSDIVSADSVAGSGRFVLDINNINNLGNLTKETTVQIADGALRDSDYITIDENTPYAMGPIQKYRLTYDDGFLSFAKMGGKTPGINEINPAVMSSAVAAQTGAYFGQLEALESSFYRMDRHFRFSRDQRLAFERGNAYASLGEEGIYRPHIEESAAMWVKPYTSFEKVSLRGGVDVSNVMYGALYGGDSEFFNFGRGFRGTISPFIGYNGSHQSFNGVSMYQNGGVIGLNGTLYKGNFFTGLTLSTGASTGQASTMFGNDNFTMLTAGAGSKTGYNFELKEGRFIIQPNVFVGYTFVNTFDYTNSANIKIKSDPLNAIQVMPGINLIGNLKNGWQPYIGVNMVLNFMGESKVNAYDTRLPQLSVKPYVQYGAGIQKTWKDNFSAYFQTMLRQGGRQGVAFGAGFSWAIGRDSFKKIKNKKKDKQ